MLKLVIKPILITIPHLCLFLFLLTGCSTIRTEVRDDVSIDDYRSGAIVVSANSTHGVEELIAEILREEGRKITMVQSVQQARDGDFYITFNDLWGWDLDEFLIQLNIFMHDADTDAWIAQGVFDSPHLDDFGPIRDKVRGIMKPWFD